MAFPQMKAAKDVRKGDEIWDGDGWMLVEWVNDWPQKSCVVFNFDLGVSEPIDMETPLMVRPASSQQQRDSSVEMRLRQQLANIMIVAIPVAKAEWAPRESDLKRLREVLARYDGGL